jgi:regulator of sirC expression with transglutaminase-like and TPR domain
MEPSTTAQPKPLPDRQQTALLTLLADEDPAIYHAVRDEILSQGPAARAWLQPHRLSSDPVLRRRTQELVRHFDRQSADEAFLAFCLRTGEDFSLEEAAWLLARTVYPEINVEAYQALLDSFAGELRERVSGELKKPRHMLEIVSEYLFTELAFVGNERDYYDPENSYLNRVLDRRTGNPINLSLFYLLIMQRLKLPVVGIGLPGHFLCRYQSSVEEHYIDPFHHGQRLTKADCVHRLVRGNHDLNEEYLSPVSSRRLFARICRNLHQTYLQMEAMEEATRLQRYLIALEK